MAADFFQQLAAGAALYRAGRYHAAHEAWEEAWREARGPRRALLHGLIQVAAGMLKCEAHRPGGAATLFTRALGHLWPLRPACEGVEVAPLVTALEEGVRLLRAGRLPPAPPPLTLRLPAPGAHVTPPPRARPPTSLPLAHTHAARCPSCGEPVEVLVEGVGAREEQYVEDCPVCCRPWRVQVTREDGAVAVQLVRSDG